MLHRILVFTLSVVAAIAIGLFVRQGEQDATESLRRWPGVMELKAHDTLLQTRPRSSARPDIVLVVADDASVKRYGKLPFSRDVWALALRQVQVGGAKVAIFDMALDRRTGTAADAALWRTMANGRRTVLGMGYNAKQPQIQTADDVRSLRFLEKFAIADNVLLKGAAAAIIWDWPLFEPPVSDFTGSARGTGIFLREPDPDGILRHARLLYRSQVKTPLTVKPLPGNLPISKLNGFEVLLPSLALSAARQTFGIDKTNLTIDGDAIHFAGNLDPPVAIPIDLSARMIINYVGPTGAFTEYPLADVAQGRVSPAEFRDKVVIFGITAAKSQFTDVQVTPYGLMPRVEITANALGSILSRSYLARVRGNALVGVMVVLGLVAGLLLVSRRALIVLLIGLAIALLYVVVAWSAVTFGGILLPLLPALAFLFVATLLGIVCSLVFRAPPRRGLYFE